MLIALLSLVAAAAPATPSPDCLDASVERDIPVNFTGRLERQVYPGPPEYMSIRRGDRPETVYILVLDRSICLNEDVGIGAPRTPFRRIQLYTGRDALWPRLRAAVGHRIRISGRGFGAHTGHHREPLVVDVASLQVRR